MRKTAIVVAMICLAGAALAAGPGDVVINEVAWMGTSNTGDEWLELYNTTAADIDLNGWYILDDGSTTYILDSSNCAGGDCTIPAGGYFVIEDNEGAIGDITADAVIDISLGNSGDSLELFDDNDNSIDLVDCANGWYAGDNSTDSTMERRDPTFPGTLPANWGTNDGVTINGTDANASPINGTPGAQNSIFGPLPGPEVAHVHCLDATAIDVVFNTAVEQVSAEQVGNYTLNAGGSDITPTAAVLDGSDASVVHLTGIAGLNDGDLTTLTVSGVRDAVTDIAADDSARFLAGIVDIATVRADADASLVPDLFENDPDVFFTVTGLVTAVKPFDGRESFVQDQSGGLAVFDGPTSDALQRGDEIRISGLIDHYRGKDEITACRFTLLSQGNPLPPQVLTLAELAADPERWENMLLGIAAVNNTGGGDAWPASGNANLEVSDDGGTTLYTLRIDSTTGIPGNPEPTWPVNVMAIAGQYTSTTPPSDGYQIMPRAYSDFTAGTVDDDCDGLDDDLDGQIDEDADLTLVTQCGACGNDCTTLANTANQVCDTSGAGPQCGYDCSEGFADCNTDPADGCEVALGTVDNCSDCGDSCLAANASASTCDAGSCTLVCDQGYDDCNDTYADGCETQLHTDANCASCGDDCSTRYANASGSCDAEAGTCVFGGCLDDYGDCNGDTADGCETALTSTDHCGACDVTCQPGQACIDEGAGYVCTSACQDADGDGFAAATCGGTDCDDTSDAIHPGASELCDGLDNNCQDGIDEDWPELGTACDSDADADLCALGQWACNDEKTGISCQGDVAQQEACNGEDDDCDGQTDEEWPDLGTPCDSPVDEDQCQDGVLVCNSSGNGLICNDDDASREEDCNGEDDDCDGETDEGFGEYTCGTGVCRVTVQACVSGQWQGCVPDTSSPNFEQGAEVSCADGLDNDCDGYTDDEDTADCRSGGGGCGCASSSPASSGGWLLLLLGMLWWRRRS